MTGLEINKKIAELKGLPYALDAHGTSMLLIDNAWVDWAGHIFYAWELFEEMPMPQITKYDHPLPFSCSSDFVSPVLQPFQSETAPRAICLAWLAWKERQQNLADQMTQEAQERGEYE